MHQPKICFTQLAAGCQPGEIQHSRRSCFFVLPFIGVRATLMAGKSFVVNFPPPEIMSFKKAFTVLFEIIYNICVDKNTN